MALPSGRKYAYSTLITRANYLAGVVILAHTLRKHGSQYPLIVFYTPSLDASAVRALELEAPKTNLILQPCDLLLPPSNVKTWLIAERFTDTWTKLRVFDLPDYDAVAYLDADMAIFNRNMDEVFDSDRVKDLPSDSIAANHACVCNKERDAWAPEEWNEVNCAYTPLSHPEALTKPTEVTPESRGTYHLLNSGMFFYRPSQNLWDEMLHFFNTTDKLSTFKFPDQDFLAEFFHNRWRSLGWQYNALKTMRYWHPGMWRDSEVVCLHYIVDKPWAERIREDGTAGYKGNDGETHRWWWSNYDDWEHARSKSGDSDVLKLVRKKVAKPHGEETESDDDPDMKAIGAKVQAFAENKEPDKDEADGKNEANGEADGGGGEQDDGEHSAPGGPVYRKKMLGERGHGPRVRANGSSMMQP